MDLFPWLLFAHVLGAIIAFGPTYSFPLIGAMGGKERMHANFATRVSYAIAKRVSWPLALVQGLTGVGLIVARNIDLTKVLWLDVAIVLYVIALGFSYFVQTPTVARVIEMTSTPPPPPAPGAAPSGPPPELMALIRRVQRGGMVLTTLVAVIVALMVLKPTF